MTSWGLFSKQCIMATSDCIQRELARKSNRVCAVYPILISSSNIFKDAVKQEGGSFFIYKYIKKFNILSCKSIQIRIYREIFDYKCCSCSDCCYSHVGTDWPLALRSHPDCNPPIILHLLFTVITHSRIPL